MAQVPRCALRSRRGPTARSRTPTPSPSVVPLPVDSWTPDCLEASSARPAFSSSETGEIICESGRRRLRMDVAKLDALQLFDGLSAQQREMVANYAVEVDVPEGKVLVRDGALAWDFYVIEEGSADVRRGQKILATLGAGDFFGEMGAMASDQRRTASVVATSPMKAIRLTTHQLRRIADESPDITERLRTAIADREQRLL